MIEGDEVFQYGCETGYRICSATSDSPEWYRTFSAHWDPNDSNCLFLCSQNGQLKTVNMRTNETNTYVVKFRRFVPPGSSLVIDVPAKQASYHFDKMLPIPGHPGEFIFLLGISKSIMYSVLPGGASGSPICSTSVHGSEEYIHGCPVMEISTHTSRITSIDVSRTGHLLASGDALGTIKIICLFTFAADKDPDYEDYITDAANLDRIENDGKKLALQAHTGPVFALNWLPQVRNSQSHVDHAENAEL